MWRASVCALALFALRSGAVADDTHRANEDDEPDRRSRRDRDHDDDDSPPEVDLRTKIGTQLADEAAVIDQTRATVASKLAGADTTRLERLRAAYRLLRAPARSTATPDERMAAARRRAGARFLLDRDAAERALLVEEGAHLATATERTQTATYQLPTLVLPEALAWPVRGQIARKFGTLVHERSKATLSRRGIDLEVEARSSVTAPAAGTVRYAGPIRGLDNGVILEHGDYYTVLAKLGDLAIPAGATVETGDRVGRAARHRVYIEVRVRVGAGGLPIDPEPLFEAGSRAARSKKSR